MIDIFPYLDGSDKQIMSTVVIPQFVLLIYAHHPDFFTANTGTASE